MSHWRLWESRQHWERGHAAAHLKAWPACWGCVCPTCLNLSTSVQTNVCVQSHCDPPFEWHIKNHTPAQTELFPLMWLHPCSTHESKLINKAFTTALAIRSKVWPLASVREAGVHQRYVCWLQNPELYMNHRKEEQHKGNHKDRSEHAAPPLHK